MFEKELYPIIRSADLSNVSFENIKISNEVITLADCLSKNVFVSNETRMYVAKQSKFFLKKKRELGITTEIENLIKLEFFNSIIGAVASMECERELTKKKVIDEINTLPESYKKILYVLSNHQEGIKQSVLAEELKVKSPFITKRFKDDRLSDLVRIYRLNERCVYYYLNDDAMRCFPVKPSFGNDNEFVIRSFSYDDIPDYVNNLKNNEECIFYSNNFEGGRIKWEPLKVCCKSLMKSK